MILSSDMLLFCKEHEGEDIPALALKASLYPQIDMNRAIQQIKGLQTAKLKYPSWYNNKNIIYPKHLSLEQSSSELTAKYKQRISKGGDRLIDLTGGMGVDTFFLAQKYKETTYVEQQEELVEIAKHNFAALEQNSITAIRSDALKYLDSIDSADLIYIDPARRDDVGRKIVSIADCTPNLLDIREKLEEKAKIVMIKLSPMLDISLACSQLESISKIHVVSVDNECKEILFIQEHNHNVDHIQRYCINIRKDSTESFSYIEEENENAKVNYTSTVKNYLYEPNASIMKAGAYNILAERYDLEKLHINSHLYTSDALVENFPGRIFVVKNTSSLSKNGLKKNISILDKANISTRNFPLKTEELKKRLRLKDGGNKYIFGSTLCNNQKILIICEKYK